MGPCRSTCMWIGMQTPRAYLRLNHCQSKSILHLFDCFCLENAIHMEFAVNRSESTTAGRHLFSFCPTRSGDRFCRRLVVSQKQKQPEAAHNCPTLLIIELAPVKDFWRQPLTRGQIGIARLDPIQISTVAAHFSVACSCGFGVCVCNRE